MLILLAILSAVFLITELWRNSEAQMISKEVALRKSSAEVRSDRLVTPV